MLLLVIFITSLENKYFKEYKNEFSPKKIEPNSAEKKKKEKNKICDSELISLEMTNQNSSNLGELKPISSKMKEFLITNVSNGKLIKQNKINYVQKDIEKWFIEYKALSFDKLIGTGSSSEVFLGKWNSMDVGKHF